MCHGRALLMLLFVDFYLKEYGDREHTSIQKNDNGELMDEFFDTL